MILFYNAHSVALLLFCVSSNCRTGSSQFGAYCHLDVSAFCVYFVHFNTNACALCHLYSNVYNRTSTAAFVSNIATVNFENTNLECDLNGFWGHFECYFKFYFVSELNSDILITCKCIINNSIFPSWCHVWKKRCVRTENTCCRTHHAN